MSDGQSHNIYKTKILDETKLLYSNENRIKFSNCFNKKNEIEELRE